MEIDCPIRSILIPGLQTPIDLAGLIVIVGPNSSGKTQLLQDLNEIVLGQKRDLVVLSSVRFNEAPDYEKYFQLLVSNGTVVQRNQHQYQKRSFQFGSEQGSGDLYKNLSENHYAEYRSTLAGKDVTRTIPFSEFLQTFGAFSGSALFLKNRLTLMDTGNNFDAAITAPTTTLQVLHLNSQAKADLQSEIAATFNRGIWIDAIGRYGHLVARISNTSNIPSANDRLEPDKMGKYRGIETEGDGIRSYAAICATLLLERRSLCLIDEPEMCLHPPQAYAMGRFIGKHVSSDTATVVSTHSSHVLRGILEANPKAHVIRLSQSESKFKARLLEPEALVEATSKPRSRAEAILEGLFAQVVLICESDGDRIVYESAYRALSGRKIDIRFVTAEGTGGFADPLRLYLALGVPSVVVADLDFLAKDGDLKSVLAALGTDGARAKELCGRARTAMQNVKLSSTQFDATGVVSELRTLVDSLKGSANFDTNALRGKLTKLAEKLNPLDQLKKTGINSIAEEWKPDSKAGTTMHLRQEVENLLRALQSHGLFLVPVGELESWLPILMNGITRDDKGRWAMLAAEKIEATGAREDDVWTFIRSVAQYLSNRCGIQPAESGHDNPATN